MLGGKTGPRLYREVTPDDRKSVVKAAGLAIVKAEPAGGMIVFPQNTKSGP